MSLGTLFGSPSGSNGKTVFLGLPFANGSEASNGCQQGPDTIRSLSRSFDIQKNQFFQIGSQQAYLRSDDISDLGNLDFRIQLGTEKYLKTIAGITAALAQQKKKFFYFGGDHLATLGTIRGLSQQIPQFQIVHLDAHKDYRETSADEFPTHANFMFFAEKESSVAKIIQIGVRGFDTSSLNSDKCVQLGANADLVQQLSEQLLPGIPAFITIDTDAFDPLVMPAVNFPVPNGLSLDAVASLIEALVSKRIPILGFDWMEYNPEFDSKNKITGVTILHKIAHILNHLSNTDY